MNKSFVSLKICLVLASFLLLSGFENLAADVEESTRWRDAIITQLDVDFGGTGFHARWTFHRCLCGDLRVQVEQVAPDSILTGELLLVNGQMLLARDFKEQGGDIEPLIQAPSLMLQLANAMLNRSQPMGPYAVNEKQLWNENEELIDFRLNTGLATGIFAAPWGVKGSGWKTDAGDYRFELLFQFTNAIPGEASRIDSITLSGLLDFSERAFPYTGSTSLEGWDIQWISENETESKPVEKDLTLENLRKQVKEDK